MGRMAAGGKAAGWRTRVSGFWESGSGGRRLRHELVRPDRPRRSREPWTAVSWFD